MKKPVQFPHTNGGEEYFASAFERPFSRIPKRSKGWSTFLKFYFHITTEMNVSSKCIWKDQNVNKNFLKTELLSIYVVLKHFTKIP